MRKFGTGEILSDDEEEVQKTAKPNWTDRDREELEKENKDSK